MNVQQFRTALRKFKATVTTMRKQAHELAVFVISHSQEHGDLDYLNEFVDTLTKGMQASFKRYIIMVCAKDEGDLSTSWITMKGGKYVINTDVKTRTCFYRDKEVNSQLNSASELYKYACFLDIDPDKVKNPFDTPAFLKAMEGMIARAKSDHAEVDKDIINFSEKMLEKAKEIASNKNKFKTSSASLQPLQSNSSVPVVVQSDVVVVSDDRVEVLVA